MVLSIQMTRNCHWLPQTQYLEHPITLYTDMYTVNTICNYMVYWPWTRYVAMELRRISDEVRFTEIHWIEVLVFSIVAGMVIVEIIIPGVLPSDETSTPRLRISSSSNGVLSIRTRIWSAPGPVHLNTCLFSAFWLTTSDNGDSSVKTTANYMNLQTID